MENGDPPSLFTEIARFDRTLQKRHSSALLLGNWAEQWHVSHASHRLRTSPPPHPAILVLTKMQEEGDEPLDVEGAEVYRRHSLHLSPVERRNGHCDASFWATDKGKILPIAMQDIDAHILLPGVIVPSKEYLLRHRQKLKRLLRHSDSEHNGHQESLQEYLTFQCNLHRMHMERLLRRPKHPQFVYDIPDMGIEEISDYDHVFFRMEWEKRHGVQPEVE